jgi:hypothetical protein
MGQMQRKPRRRAHAPTPNRSTQCVGCVEIACAPGANYGRLVPLFFRRLLDRFFEIFALFAAGWAEHNQFSQIRFGLIDLAEFDK